MLRLLRPQRRMFGRIFVVPSLHFLQKQDVGFHGRKRLFQRVNPRHAAQCADAFMNVIRRNAKFHEWIVGAVE